MLYITVAANINASKIVTSLVRQLDRMTTGAFRKTSGDHRLFGGLQGRKDGIKMCGCFH